MAELPKPFLPPKQMLESEIACLKAQNKRLEAEKDEIQEDRQALRSRVSELEQSNAHLQQEVERLRALKFEKDSLQSDLGSKEEEEEEEEEEAEKMVLEWEKQEKIRELGEVTRERDALLEEKKEREKKFELMAEDSTSIVLSMLVAHTDLEERLDRRREFGAEKDGKKHESFGLKGAAKMVRSLAGRCMRRT